MPRPDPATNDPEQAVLVAALRGRPLPPIHDEVRLAALANWHRLEGLLARQVADQGVGSDDLVAHLAEARAGTEARWGRLRRRLAELVGAWDRAGLAVTLLKGAALVEAGIVPAGERPMADLDLLVDDDEAGRAHAIARDAGFTSTQRPDTWEYASTRHHHLPVLHDRDGQVAVEVHHRLLDGAHPQRRLDAVARRHRTPLEALPIDRLDDVGSWLHLAVHCWDDRRRGTGGPLLQLRDLALLLDRLDVPELATTARRAGATRLVATMASVLTVVVADRSAESLRAALDGPHPDHPRVRSFVATRVLGRRSPLAQLVHPTASVRYSPWRLATRTRRQLWLSPEEVRRAYGPHATRRDHLASLAPVLGDGIRAPGTTIRDLVLDRWAHGVVRDVAG